MPDPELSKLRGEVTVHNARAGWTAMNAAHDTAIRMLHLYGCPWGAVIT